MWAVNSVVPSFGHASETTSSLPGVSFFMTTLKWSKAFRPYE